MNRNLRWAFGLALLPIAACSSKMPPMAAVVPPPAPMLAAPDQAFMTAAASSDSAEIQAAQLAQTKGHNPRIKAFAAKMIADHTDTTTKLNAIAQSKGVTVTPVTDDMINKYQALITSDKPRAFDHDYIHGQVEAHMAAITAFQSEIDNGQDADLKAFATATMPTLKQHLSMAQRLDRH